MCACACVCAYMFVYVCVDTICNDTQISILNGCLIAELVVFQMRLRNAHKTEQVCMCVPMCVSELLVMNIHICMYG